jgi:hypothetical protein
LSKFVFVIKLKFDFKNWENDSGVDEKSSDFVFDWSNKFEFVLFEKCKKFILFSFFTWDVIWL